MLSLRFLIILMSVMLASICDAGHLHHEKWYQDKWCIEHGGRTNVRMPDGTYCDCITDEYAIEFDFAPKWAEALGQSLNYGLQSNRQAAIVLILESDRQLPLWIRLNSVIQNFHLPITTWSLSPSKLF